LWWAKITHWDFSIFSPSTSQATLPEILLASDSVSASCNRTSAIDGSEEVV